MAEDSGTIRLHHGIISYDSPTYGCWSLSLSDVLVIGEATNQDGPGIDDWFLCFSTGSDMWHEASFYAEGRDQFLREISAALDVELQSTLAASTDFASNVLWPPELAGHVMFKYTDVPSAHWWQRLWNTGRNLQTYTDEIRQFLDSREGTACIAR